MEQRDMMNEYWQRFFKWLKEHPEGGIFTYLNLTLEVTKKKTAKRKAENSFNE